MLDSRVNQPPAADLHVRLRQLERENSHLRELTRSLTVAATDHRSVRGRAPLAAATSGAWRQCEFCGCNTNAEERLCCASGRSADRQSWDPA